MLRKDKSILNLNINSEKKRRFIFLLHNLDYSKNLYLTFNIRVDLFPNGIISYCIIRYLFISSEANKK